MTDQSDNSNSQWRLSDADAEAIDRLIESRAQDADSGADADLVSHSFADDRQQQAADLLELIGSCPAEEPPDTLVDDTIARIAQIQTESRLAGRERNASPIPFRLRELIALAAVLLLSLSVLWPVMERSATNAREVTCRANLQSSSVAFARYASDHSGMLPRGPVNPQGTWYKVGTRKGDSEPVESNSANLYLLVRQNYISPALLYCPENHKTPKDLPTDGYDWPNYEAVPFSYQNQARPIRLNDDPLMPVLADKNPQFEMHQEKFVYLDLADKTNSAMHQGRGQNVLLQDGSVHWTTEPVTPVGRSAGDLIYKAAGVDEYDGDESPSRPDDAFAVP